MGHLGVTMIGRTLGHFRITEFIDGGGQAKVWKAFDTVLERFVAIKTLSEQARDERARQRFVREAKTASRLKHRGIATVHDAGFDGDVPYIVYEYVEGETLLGKMAGGSLPVEEALRLTAEAADALAHAHERGVLHRDISARNIMVDQEGHAVIIDFGLALYDDSATRLTADAEAMGTPAYMPPELFRGRDSDRRSDLYSLGSVLYQMLTGRPPFRAEQPNALSHMILNEDIVPPSQRRAGIDPNIDHIVLRLLARNPDDRYQSASELLRAMESNEGTTRVIQTIRRPWRRVVGRRTVVVAALALLAIVAPYVVKKIVGLMGRTPTLAVLPLRNLSPEPTLTAHIAASVGLSLTAKLSLLDSPRILPWETTRRYTGHDHSLQEIAEELGAEQLITGTFARDREEVYATISLIDGKSGLTEWTLEFDEPWSAWLDVQKQIALQVARRIAGTISPETATSLAKPSTSNLEAYELYLRGASLMLEDEKRYRELALRYFQQARDLDPELAEAYVGIGTVITDQYFRGHVGDERRALAVRSFERAIELRPELVAAYRGLIHTSYHVGKTAEVCHFGTRALLAGRGSIESLLAWGEALLLSSAPARSAEVLRIVLELDPANWAARWFLVVAESWSGQHERAVASAEETMRRFGEDAEILTWQAISLDQLGQVEQAAAILARAMEIFGRDSNQYIFHYAAMLQESLGDTATARAIQRRGAEYIEALLKRAPDNHRSRGYLTILYANLDELRQVELHSEILLREAADHGMAMAALSGAYWILGDTTRASQLGRLALNLGQLETSWAYTRIVQSMDHPQVLALKKERERRVQELHKQCQPDRAVARGDLVP